LGRNSSGKSNLLRALNLFFNGEVESGKELSFARDYHERPQSRKKKVISIAVEFSLPRYFKYRPGLKHLSALGRDFTIVRKWELDPQRRPLDSLVVEGAPGPVPDQSEAARQFLGLISYRYIPNRQIPAVALRAESQSIADSVFLRLKGDKHSKALLDSLSAAAGRMLQSADRSMKAAGAPLTAPTIAIGETLGEMLTMSGFQAIGGNARPVQDEEWGAGHQAFFMHEVLHTLDTNYGRFFGWRQATVWGVEEPESSLHRDLETRLAGLFRNWANDEDSRLQILLTTHSPVFSMVSDVGYWSELSGPESEFTRTTIPELTRKAEVHGVSGWTHPVLSFPWNPVVLVEGQIDVDVLYHVSRIAGLEHLRFLSLPELDSDEKRGGKDPIRSYLKRNAQIVANRPREAPLMVLLDWDVSTSELTAMADAYGVEGKASVLRMNSTYCDALLGEDFRGIERFYPPKIVSDAHSGGELVLGVAKGKPYSISPTQMKSAKYSLSRRLLRVTKVTELESLIAVVRDVDKAVRDRQQVQIAIPGY